ncbi:MAG: hypothetical protein FJ395_11750 [Verrucomicrobia bacterium]|nr:hypothetical protein [Verrucomicrobiota bacterium]
MAFTRKSPTPIDRAVAEIQQRITDLERQAQHTETQTTGSPASSTVWKDWFAPPPRHTSTARRRSLPNEPVEPLKELEQQPLPFEEQPDLFNRSPEKMAQYFKTGSTKGRTPLRHELRQNRHRFYLWLGLAIVVLGLLWLVMG